MVQTSFQLDEGTAKAIDELKDVFGVKSNTSVIRRAIALSRIAARSRDLSDDTITVLSADRVATKVALKG